MTIVGTRQQTLQSFTNDRGNLTFHEHLDRTNWGGDGTVYLGAASPKGQPFDTPLPQQHGALANSNFAIGLIADTLVGAVTGPPQGDGIGLATPDVVVVGQPFEIRVSAPAFAGVSCTLEEPGVRNLGGIPLTQRTTDLGEPEQYGPVSISQPGLYTVTAVGGGFADVSCDVLVVPDD
jgi:hypothetical protein